MPQKVKRGYLLVPTFRGRQGDVLRFGRLDSASRTVKAGDDLLDRFASLETDKDFEEFARRFGPLGLVVDKDEVRPDPLSLGGAQGVGGIHREPIMWWRRYQTEFELLLKLAAFVHATPTLSVGEGDLEILENLRIERAHGDALGADLIESEGVDWDSGDPSRQRRAVGGVLLRRVNKLVYQCDVRPGLILSDRGFDLVFRDLVFSPDAAEGHLSLFGTLTMQLVTAVLGKKWIICLGCKKVFAPKGNQSKYCFGCGRQAALRDAKRRYRTKLRAGS